MPREKSAREVDPIVTELREIKRLLILALVKAGTTSEEIAQALRLHAGYVRRMYPMGKVKRAKERK